MEAMTQEGTVEIMYEGTKYFPATESLFRIALVDHSKLDTIEVVAYEKRHAVETSRIYLNCSILLSRINEDSVETRFRSIKEQAMKSHAIPDLTRMRKLATCEVIFDFVLLRLFSSGGSTANTLMLEFRLLTKDLMDPQRFGYDVRDLVCEKPYSLQEFRFDTEIFSSGPSLSAKQKWRIPIVLAKVAKGRQLSVCDSKIWESISRGVADAEVETEGFEPALPTDEAVVTHTRVPFAGRQDRMPKRIEHKKEAITEVAGTGPIKERLLSRQPSVRKSSFSVGLDALTSSLQRSLNTVRGISMDASHKPQGGTLRPLNPSRDHSISPKSSATTISSPRTPLSATVHLTAPAIPPVNPAAPALPSSSAEDSTATGAHGGDSARGYRRGSRALHKGASVSRLARGDSHRWSDSATPTNSKVASVRFTSDMCGSFSGKYAGVSLEGQATRREKVFSRKMSDTEPYISPCERANRELKAARLMAKLNVDAASASTTELSVGAQTGTDSFEDVGSTARRRAVNFPEDGSMTMSPAPRRARTRNPPAAIQHLFPRSAMVGGVVGDDSAAVREVKQKPSAVTNVATLGDAVLQPVLRLVHMVTRRSISAVVPAE